MGQEREPPCRCHVFPLDIASGSALKNLVCFLPREQLALGGTETWGAERVGLGWKPRAVTSMLTAQLRLSIFICKMGTNQNTLFPGL